jgi:Ca2+-binding EF-hand superfamily protein
MTHRVKKQDLAYAKQTLKRLVDADRKRISSRKMKSSTRIRHSLEWNVNKIKRVLHDKIVSRVRRPQDTMRVAYKIFGVPKDGINKASFKKSMRRLDMNLSEEEFEEIFAIFDPDGSGIVTFQEFINALIPRGFSEKTWTEKRAAEIHEHSRNYIHPDAPNFPASMKNFRWSLSEIESMIREKMMNHCKRPEDQFRAGFQLFGRPKHGIGPEVLLKTLRKLGISLTRDEAINLMVKHDTDGSGKLDFEEFAQSLMPKDYSRDPWSYKRSKQFQQELRARQLRVGVNVVKEHASLLKERSQKREDARVQQIHDRTERFRQAQQRLNTTFHAQQRKNFIKERRRKTGARPKSVLTSLYNKRAMSTIDARVSPLKVSQSMKYTRKPRARSAYGSRSGVTVDGMMRSKSSSGLTMNKTVGFDMTATAGGSAIDSERSEHSGTSGGILKNKRHRAQSAYGQRSTGPSANEQSKFGGGSSASSRSGSSRGQRPFSAAPGRVSKRHLQEALQFSSGSPQAVQGASSYLEKKLSRHSKRPKTPMMLSGLSLRTVQRDVKSDTRVKHHRGWGV